MLDSLLSSFILWRFGLNLNGWGFKLREGERERGGEKLGLEGGGGGYLWRISSFLPFSLGLSWEDGGPFLEAYTGIPLEKSPWLYFLHFSLFGGKFYKRAPFLKHRMHGSIF